MNLAELSLPKGCEQTCIMSSPKQLESNVKRLVPAMVTGKPTVWHSAITKCWKLETLNQALQASSCGDWPDVLCT